MNLKRVILIMVKSKLIIIKKKINIVQEIFILTQYKKINI